MPEWVTLVKGDQSQKLAVGDLRNGGVALLAKMIDSLPVSTVYSDPPWSPGNEKYWRTHAGLDGGDYSAFIEAWLDAVALCRGLRHVFCEQSNKDGHRSLFMDAAQNRDFPPLLQEWTVFYSSPRRPNRLLHFGLDRIETDPSGLAGEVMTRTVFDGLHEPSGTIVMDPCTGKGMTSRMAHRFAYSFIGLELNPIRLEATINWLLKQGYEQA